MNGAVLERINACFPLKRLDPGEYSKFKASPLDAELEWYAAEGLGRLSYMRGKAMGGLMKMDTLVITALERDVPLFSYDMISAMGKITMLVEYYDILLDAGSFDNAAAEAAKQSVSQLPDHELGEHWYDSMKLAPSWAKRVKKKDLSLLEDAFSAALDAYLTSAKQNPVLDEQQREQKRALAAGYVNGLLEKGGPSTDAFKKALGEDETRALFTRIIFSTEE